MAIRRKFEKYIIYNKVKVCSYCIVLCTGTIRWRLAFACHLVRERVARVPTVSSALKEARKTSLRPAILKTFTKARHPQSTMTGRGTLSTGSIEIAEFLMNHIDITIMLSWCRKFWEQRQRREGADRTRVDLSDCINDLCPEINIKTGNMNIDYNDANCEKRLKLWTDRTNFHVLLGVETSNWQNTVDSQVSPYLKWLQTRRNKNRRLLFVVQTEFSRRALRVDPNWRERSSRHCPPL